ncbi:B3 domain-containing protein At3g06220-like [Spinacia oleracea]|uniref:B3 domain-containing protein At3g06220-like n=1 Tax=Spinacia oleracea TaxID=3562 RepID=A0ABM3QZX4_SPIOL|nr:B3 domain-containing protein At3g06220-like [Spinacia oleracea]
MGSSEEKLPEFFKTFRPDHYSETMKIPDAFLEHLSTKIPKKVILKNCFDDHWPVGIVENEDGLFFQEGWSKLVSDYPLLGGEFMVFKYDGYSTFEIRTPNTSHFKKQPVTGCFAGQEEAKTPTEEDNEDEEDLVVDQAENSAIRKNLGRGGNYSFTGYHVKNLGKGITDLFPSNNPFFVTKIRKNDGRKDLRVVGGTACSGEEREAGNSARRVQEDAGAARGCY